MTDNHNPQPRENNPIEFSMTRSLAQMSLCRKSMGGPLTVTRKNQFDSLSNDVAKTQCLLTSFKQRETRRI